MSKIAATSGGLGDIVYSIPIMRELGVKLVYVKESWYHHPYHSLYSCIKTLLNHEGFDVLPTNGELRVGKFERGLKYDYNLDSFRRQDNRGKVHIQTNLRKQFNLKQQPFRPWLNISTAEKGYNLIQLTERWRNASTVDWKVLFQNIPKPVYFIGFQYEWLDFQLNYGDLEWMETNDILDMAHLIANCDNLYCNQSVGLTLAQGLGKRYFLELKPGKTNTRMYLSNENILT